MTQFVALRASTSTSTSISTETTSTSNEKPQSPTSTPTSVQSPPSNSSSLPTPTATDIPSGINTGAKVGIGIGSVAAVFLVGMLAYLYWKLRETQGIVARQRQMHAHATYSPATVVLEGSSILYPNQPRAPLGHYFENLSELHVSPVEIMTEERGPQELPTRP
ncbi:hypothetical protein F5Y10DRAFT_263331 [Nemania abortiva]|nr:hypothetical protein F5Y10DRAFT_263331 [Nemania abortiva]